MSRALMPLPSSKRMTILRSEATGLAMMRLSTGAFFNGGAEPISIVRPCGVMAAGTPPVAAAGAMFSSVDTLVLTPFSVPAFSKG